MSTRKISFAVEEYYHLYNRGSDKRVIFMDNHDYRRFVALLYLCNGTKPVDTNLHFYNGHDFLDLFNVERGDTLVDIGVYCLMPNHFHLLVRGKVEGGVVKFMSKLLTAYAVYFNNKHTRTGSLFEGKFKAKHVDSDEYLKYLFAYQHLNPVKIIDPKWREEGIADRNKAKQFLGEYIYSSYLDYQGSTRIESKVLNREVFPLYFTKVSDFDAFINEWITFPRKELPS